MQRSSFGNRLRGLRLAKGLSQVDLARLIGRHQTVIGPYERDEYEPPREIVERLAGLLETTPEYLYFGRSPRRSAIPMAGRLGALGLLDATLDETDTVLTLKDEQLRAYQVADDSMAPAYRQGQIVLVAALEATPVDHLGRDALIELADGRSLLRRLLPSASAALFDLGAYNAPTLMAVAVQQVKPVLGALWPDAWVGLPDRLPS
jgi:transcriptional regulator with XRE-family HTH domain